MHFLQIQLPLSKNWGGELCPPSLQVSPGLYLDFVLVNANHINIINQARFLRIWRKIYSGILRALTVCIKIQKLQRFESKLLQRVIDKVLLVRPNIFYFPNNWTNQIFVWLGARSWIKVQCYGNNRKLEPFHVLFFQYVGSYRGDFKNHQKCIYSYVLQPPKPCLTY